MGPSQNTQTLDVDRFNQIYRMIHFLGRSKRYLVKSHSYAEGMTSHWELFQVGITGPIAVLSSYSNKNFELTELRSVPLH